ncbi:SRPBCC domain-containing protein [bacterium]|nr:SRPBCC domain-containing protein [bacterium]
MSAAPGNQDHSQAPDEVRVSRLLKASPQRVWQVIASEAGMRQWMGLQLFQPQLDGRVLYDTNAGPGERIIIWGRVKELIQEQRISMSWRVMRENGWMWPQDTLLSLELEELAAGCRVTLLHSGFAALGESAAVSYQVYHHCWVQTSYLQLLDSRADAAAEGA